MFELFNLTVTAELFTKFTDDNVDASQYMRWVHIDPNGQNADMVSKEREKATRQKGSSEFQFIDYTSEDCRGGIGHRRYPPTEHTRSRNAKVRENGTAS